MATNSMIPYSNPAGNNQTTPIAGAQPQLATIPSAPPLGSTPTQAAQANPLVPVGATVPNAGLASNTNNPNVSTSTAPGTTGALSQQEVNIYGKGVGGQLTNLLDSIGGTNSATLQDYVQSLAPTEATAQAGVDASLGAGGVSANSSVAALANSNLQAQETGQIASESANLTQSGQSLDASILTGQEGAAASEVSSSGWDVLGSVLGDVGSVAGDVLGVGGIGSLIGGATSAFGGSTPTATGSNFSGTPSLGFSGISSQGYAPPSVPQGGFGLLG
jgi:hypothetical protein